jgi:hypothetical protein
MNKHYVPVPSDHYDQMDSTTSLRFNMEKEPIAKGDTVVFQEMNGNKQLTGNEREETVLNVSKDSKKDTYRAIFSQEDLHQEPVFLYNKS